ncbi:hypothetical protein BGX24_001619 [Mortierella sp. AD032]|nr:hypothetical protein BGX24_001619 [Mortierella sp. AD032]
MSVLKDLSLWASPNEEIPLTFTTTLFRCLPASLETLHLVYAMNDPEAISFSEFPALGDPNTSLPPLVTRQGPLSSLVDLRLPVFNGGYSAEITVKFLEECSGLTSLVLPQSTRTEQIPSNGAMLASMIQELCPLLRHISVLDPVGRAPMDRQSLIATLNLPSLNRFTSTLTNLRLSRIDNIARTTVCSKLEILEIAIGLATDGSDSNLAPGNPRWPMFGTLARKI